MKVLVLNAGSSSQKCALYELTGKSLPDMPPPPLWEAHADGPHLSVSVLGRPVLRETLPSAAPKEVVPRLLETLWHGAGRVLSGPHEIDLVGHRVVHGGRAYRGTARITAEVKAAIDRLSSLAPAHNPAALAGIAAAERSLGRAPQEIPQFAVFDTAFHSTVPDAAAVYPGPYAWAERGWRRYGFHGISHHYAATRAAQLLGCEPASLRLITCHLGNGCSLAAVRGGESVDTTMGFTPLEGLMMGTRSGSLDPGLLLYLLRDEGYSAAELSRILNQEAGLKGISGTSGDMREVAAASAEGDPRARLALDIYAHRVRFYIGAMLGSLGGLDALVFTAGVGEHSAALRAAVCRPFDFLGLRLDDEKNEGAAPDTDIAAADAGVRALVVHAEEAWAIARSCWEAVRAADS